MSQLKLLLPVALTFSWIGALSASPEADLNSGRLKAESLERQGQFLGCGQAYAKLYQEYPEEETADALLYNAGHCYEKAGKPIKANQEFGKLSKQFPQSSYVPKTLVRSASLYAISGDFGRSATNYEEYARRFPGESDAPRALTSAITYRQNLGQFSKMSGDIEMYLRYYRKKKPSESYALLFLLARETEKEGTSIQAVRAYERYLKVAGKAGGYNRLLVVNAKLGGLLWEQSCTGSSQDGVCGSEKIQPLRRTKNGIPNRCGKENATIPRLRKRNVALHRRANAAFARNVELEKHAKQEEKSAIESKEQVNALVASKFFSLTEEYENYLRLEFPRGLSFTANNPKKSKKSMLRFTQWLQSKQSMSKKLGAGYNEIKDNLKASPTFRIASVARMGLLTKNFSDNLQNADIPVEIRTGGYAQDSVNAYCDELHSQAKPLQESARSAFQHCIDLSASLSVHNDWTKRCERELGSLSLVSTAKPKR